MSLTHRAQAQLQNFIPHASTTYAKCRNFDYGRGAHSAVSGLSPYIRRRILHETDILKAVRGAHSYGASEKFIQEVFWRTYWKGWLEHRPAIWLAYDQGLAEDLKRLQSDPDLLARYEAVCTSRGEFECMNDWARELRETGYLHNHARMWFASIWIFTLGLPWRLGAQFFWQHLLDGDTASNTLSWRWVAGLQTLGKHYVATKGNIERFTNGRYAPEGLATNPPPLIGPAHPEPIRPDFPQADTQGRIGVILHDEDLSHSLANKCPTCIAAPALAPRHSRSEQVEAFLSQAFEEHRSNGAALALSAQDVITWAKAHDLETVIVKYIPQGPTQDAIAPWFAELTQTGLHVMKDTDPYDVLCWPHAQKGFFGFKKNIPSLLNLLQM